MGGTTSIRDLRDRLGLPLTESPDYQTIAGLLLHRLQTVPRPGMAARATGFLWTVIDMDGPRIVKVKATRLPSAAER